MPTRVDPTAAPEGKETLVVLVPVGHLLESKPTLGHQSNGHAFASGQSNGHANGHANGHVNGDANGGDAINVEKSSGKTVSSQDWPKIIARARADVLRKLTQRFGDKLDLQGGDFGHLIETEVVNTPMTWRDNLNLYKGSILGLSHNILQVLCLRPRLIHDSIKVSREMSNLAPVTVADLVDVRRNCTSSVPPRIPELAYPLSSAVLSSVSLAACTGRTITDHYPTYSLRANPARSRYGHPLETLRQSIRVKGLQDGAFESDQTTFDILGRSSSHYNATTLPCGFVRHSLCL